MKKVTVKSVKEKHAGEGYVVVDRDIMDDMGLDNGDYIRIENPRSEDEDSSDNSLERVIFARLWPGYSDDTGKRIIRIDAEAREEIDINVGNSAIIEKADLNIADSITFDIPEGYSLKGDVANILLKRLSGQAVKVGQVVLNSIGMGDLQQSVEIKISEANPDDAVIVTKETTAEIVTSDRNSTEGSRATLGDKPVSYEDIGGLDSELKQVREMIELPMSHPEIFERLGIDSPKGVLLHGPPGTGKTLIAKAVANESKAEFYSISGPEIMSKYYGESEEKLREVFEEATENSPSIIFMDELDSIASQRGGSDGDVERRIVAQLLSLMDGLEERSDVIVIGATNRIDSIDSALRRGGRFDREIDVTAPDKEGRREIIDVHTRSMPLGDSVDLDEYADKTHGFVGADIESLCKESAMTALRRVKPDLDIESDEIGIAELEKIDVRDEDFSSAIKDIEPSALREVFVEVPDVSWEDIGGLEGTKDRMREVVQWPLLYDDVFKNMSLDPAKGVLLYGPPGTGKTLLAKAVANESKSNFISIKGPELLNKYVGESEKGVREVFEKARSNAPTIVFFDEIDALAVERGQGGGSNNVGERVVSQLLTELDGLENLEDVVVIATTNRPDLIDSALLRPGRLDRHVHVPLPGKESREEVIRVHTKGVPLEDDVDIQEIAERTDGYVGADIEALCREATMQSTRDLVKDIDPEEDEFEERYTRVSMADFEYALDQVNRSVDEDTEEQYQEIEDRFEQNRVTQKDRSGIGFQ